MDALRIGVRWSRPGLDAQLRGLASGALGLQDAPPNLSVVVGGVSGRTRTKHHLHVHGQLSSTMATDGALVRAVIRALAALGAATPPDTVTINAFLVVEPGGATIVVDRRLAPDFRRLEPRLRRSGYRVIEAPFLCLRPETATILLPDAAGSVVVALNELDRCWPRHESDDDLVAGDIAVSRLVYGGYPERESLAAAVADMVPLVRDRGGRVSTGDLARLAELAGRVEIEGVPGQDRKALSRALGVR